MVFQGERTRDQSLPKEYKGGTMELIDCQLTTTEEVVHKNIRGTSDLANVKAGGYH